MEVIFYPVAANSTHFTITPSIVVLGVDCSIKPSVTPNFCFFFFSKHGKLKQIELLYYNGWHMAGIELV